MCHDIDVVIHINLMMYIVHVDDILVVVNKQFNCLECDHCFIIQNWKCKCDLFFHFMTNVIPRIY